MYKTSLDYLYILMSFCNIPNIQQAMSLLQQLIFLIVCLDMCYLLRHPLSELSVKKKSLLNNVKNADECNKVEKRKNSTNQSTSMNELILNNKCCTANQLICSRVFNNSHIIIAAVFHFMKTTCIYVEILFIQTRKKRKYIRAF